ncbi:MAG: acyl-CoA dehydrogenase family protein [Acidobacteria bacterium]|jgi:butyryl-CoA dehydrogenase|nr:acyl-CoA dehydrogenase family protein [Acidobacteriota bacterium]
MNYFLSEQEIEIRNLFSEYVNKKIIPLRKELDEKHEFPHEIFEEMARQDFFRIMVPEAYGGLGDSSMQLSLGIEELSRGDAGISVSFAVDAIATKGIILYGNETQKQKYLPAIADGKMYTAFAITEPGSGSDAGSIKTKAVKKGNKYVLDGVKQFITNGENAQIVMVIAVTDPGKGYKGHTAFLVEKGTPGFTPGKREDKMGIRSSVTNELIFDNCEVPEENIVGTPGQGFYIALGLLDRSRIGIGAQALGIAQGALDEALNYSGTREQFGKPINSFQAIQHMLADMATQIEAARTLVYHASRVVDSGGKDMTKISAMAKLFATDTAMKVTTDAVQVFGGYGYMKEYPVEKMMRDAKVTQIYEGTNQIQRNVIASKLIKNK